MENMKKITTLLLISLFFSCSAASAQIGSLRSLPNVADMPSSSNLIQADIQSQRIPAGIEIKIRVENPVNTHNSRRGDFLTATVIQDIIINNNIILPAGTIMRGTVGNIKKSGYPSRGAELALSFDHIVTPVGKQVPLIARLSEAKNLTQNGTMVSGTNYLTRVESNFDEGIDTVIDITNMGIKGGLAFGKGYPVIITAPLAAAGGVTIGSTIFFAKSVIALFKKGDNVILSSGEILEVTLKEALDIPAN